jgi:phosphoribosylaminoimidazole-succinocarboxamide synthase
MPILLKDASFIDLPVLIRGKVRDVFDLGDSLLMVATDRISAFDVVFRELIPDKGVVLNSISAFWFGLTRGIVANHLITSDPAEYPESLARHAALLAGRSMLVKKIRMLPVECIVRGYLEGSGLKEYNKSGTVGGNPVPAGLRQADRLPEPIFTPSTKAESGHDINIDFAQTCGLVGEHTARLVRDKSLALYRFAQEYAEERGIILADTKFEFGLLDGELLVADEIFTPDSSRFWDKNEYEPGHAQKSFDKQFLREWLESSGWDKNPPPPALPAEIVEKTAEKYNDAYFRLTGKPIR